MNFIKVCVVLIFIIAGQSLVCYCQGSCPGGRTNGTCEAAPGAGCFAAAEEVYDPETDNLVAERTYGCLPRWVAVRTELAGQDGLFLLHNFILGACMYFVQSIDNVNL